MTNPRDIEKWTARIQADVDKRAGRPVNAVLLVHEYVEAWAEALNDLGQLRRTYVRAAIRSGTSMADLARAMGVSRQRIHQLAEDDTHTKEKAP